MTKRVFKKREKKKGWIKRIFLETLVVTSANESSPLTFLVHRFRNWKHVDDRFRIAGSVRSIALVKIKLPADTL